MVGLSCLTRFIMDCLVFLAGKSARGGLTLSEILDRLGEEMASPNLACPLDLVSPWAGPNGAYTRLEGLEIVIKLRCFPQAKEDGDCCSNKSTENFEDY